MVRAMDISKLNFLAILVAAATTFMLGGLWYSPILFAKRWMRESGVSEEQTRQANMGRVQNWDTHGNNFDQVKALAGVLDQGWAALMAEWRAVVAARKAARSAASTTAACADGASTWPSMRSTRARC